MYNHDKILSFYENVVKEDEIYMSDSILLGFGTWRDFDCFDNGIFFWGSETDLIGKGNYEPVPRLSNSEYARRSKYLDIEVYQVMF